MFEHENSNNHKNGIINLQHFSKCTYIIVTIR